MFFLHLSKDCILVLALTSCKFTYVVFKIYYRKTYHSRGKVLSEMQEIFV
jgi:hypothetical protein